MTASTSHRTGFEGHVRVLTAHDLQYFRDLERKLRTRPYDVTGTEAADGLATLRFHVERLTQAAPKAEASRQREEA